MMAHSQGDAAYNTVDSLSAFWPGLQVLAGDVENAIKSHMICEFPAYLAVLSLTCAQIGISGRNLRDYLKVCDFPSTIYNHSERAVSLGHEL